MSELAGLNALIIEPHAGMRASMHNMLSLAGMSRIEFATSAGSAIRPLKQAPYDLIICEYDLGAGQDGQQLLEDLRYHKIIPPDTLFVMVTAERTQEKVMSAAELGLNDYILKPFTADMLLERIARAADKRGAFARVQDLIEHGELVEAIDACRQGARAMPRYQPDFVRMRAELHIALGEPGEAEAAYLELLGTRCGARARLGLATTLFMQQRLEEAEAMLAALVQDAPQYMEAHDRLARVQEARGALREAQATLERAVAQSPHAVHRLRRLGMIAWEAGDVDAAHKAFLQVVGKARFSEFREPEDHVRLVKATLAKGEGQAAVPVMRELGKASSGQGKLPACKAIAAALLHSHDGETDRARQELEAAVAACDGPIGIANDIKITLAAQCLEQGLERQAVSVMADVVGNLQTPAAGMQAVRLFMDAGRDDLAKRVTQESRSRIAELVAAGAEKARLGDDRGAVALMSEAAARLPDNAQVVFNAAVAALKCLDHEGWDDRLGTLARAYVANARRLDPRNPRMSLLASMYRDIRRKHATASRHPAAGAFEKTGRAA